MHTSIGAKLFIGRSDYCLKVDEPSTNAKKNGICERICSKFSVKCESSHKNIVNVDFLMLTYRHVLHLTITVCRKVQHYVYIRTNYNLPSFFFALKGSQQNQGC